MNIINRAKWDSLIASNKDSGYGLAIMKYAEAWADLMEEKIASGERLEDIAGQTSHDADTEGISGFMYGCAVSTLASCWEHGETLRRWHNKETQIGTEGDEANENGGTLNPALLCINTPSAAEPT